jgi:tetratricopeptide (TPR) repeat protein
LNLGLGRTEVVIGNWHYRNGRIEAATEWFHKALQIAPRNSNAWAFLGQIEAQAGHMQEAAAAFGRASALRPDKGIFRHNLVKALEASGHAAETVPLYRVLCRDEPDLAENWVGAARALRAAGEAEAAETTLQSALQRFEARRRQAPEDPQAVADVAALLAGMGRTDEALAELRLVLQTHPDADAALYTSGEILVEAGRSKEARPYLERLLQRYPQHPAKDQVQEWLKTP